MHAGSFTVRSWRQKDQWYKVILGYIVSLSQSGIHEREPFLKKRKEKKEKKRKGRKRKERKEKKGKEKRKVKVGGKSLKLTVEKESGAGRGWFKRHCLFMVKDDT